MLARIGTGFVSLFVLARGLGPADYGFVATVFAYASIAALLTDFGFSVQALRDIGAEPERAGELIAACIRVKNLLVGIATVAAVITLSVLGLDPHLFWSSILLYASIIVLSYGDLALVALRGIGRYDTETYAVVAGTVIFVAIVGGTALTWPDILPVATALLGARIVQTLLSFLAVRRHIRLANCLYGPLLDIIGFAKSSSALALDSVLTTVSAQLDVIFVSAILGLEAAGVYQVAGRVAGYFLLPAQVLAGVFLPKLAAERGKGIWPPSPLKLRMQLEFSAVGALSAIGILIISQFSVQMFGAQYDTPIFIWAGFAAFIFMRYFAATFGSVLIAENLTRYRILGQAVGLVFILLAMPIVLMTAGLLWAPWVMVGSATLTSIVYIVAMRLQKKVASN